MHSYWTCIHILLFYLLKNSQSYGNPERHQYVFELYIQKQPSFKQFSRRDYRGEIACLYILSAEFTSEVFLVIFHLFSIQPLGASLCLEYVQKDASLYFKSLFQRTTIAGKNNINHDIILHGTLFCFVKKIDFQARNI